MKTILSPSRALLTVALALALTPAAHAQHAHGQHAGTPASDPHAAHASPAHVPTTSDVHAQHTLPDEPSLREPVPVPTEADRKAAFPALHAHAMEHAPAINNYVLIDRLEGWQRDGHDGQAWEAQGWIGSDLNRFWLRTEGEREAGRTADAQLELLYGRSVSPWWDVVAGVRHDFKPGDARDWAAFGVQGMAPYKFEVAATAYATDGQFAATVEAEYDVLLTNRLILQPRIEARLSAQEDREYLEGKGLNSVEASLRLRYEITRRFAPYIGVSHGRLFGDTAELHEQAGETTRETHFVAGVRFWF